MIYVIEINILFLIKRIETERREAEAKRRRQLEEEEQKRKAKELEEQRRKELAKRQREDRKYSLHFTHFFLIAALNISSYNTCINLIFRKLIA
jgi:hypothetical protein